MATIFQTFIESDLNILNICLFKLQ